MVTSGLGSTPPGGVVWLLGSLGGVLPEAPMLPEAIAGGSADPEALRLLAPLELVSGTTFVGAKGFLLGVGASGAAGLIPLGLAASMTGAVAGATSWAWALSTAVAGLSLFSAALLARSTPVAPAILGLAF